MSENDKPSEQAPSTSTRKCLVLYVLDAGGDNPGVPHPHFWKILSQDRSFHFRRRIGSAIWLNSRVGVSFVPRVHKCNGPFSPSGSKV
jgi:hypothetical protein